jgi:hypothetical protein
MALERVNTVTGCRVSIDPAAVIGIEEINPDTTALILPGSKIHVNGDFDKWQAWYDARNFAPQEPMARINAAERRDNDW